MKHPRYEVLQDYFENVLNPVQEILVKEHLLDCDQCTEILSHFTQIETKLKVVPPMPVSEALTARIFADAKNMLALKKEKADLKAMSAQERAQRVEQLKDFYQNWKESIFPEIKIPALQLCSLSLALMVFVNVERSEGVEEEIYEPIKVEVNEYTHLDVPHKVERK